jgi:hypothetical protein
MSSFLQDKDSSYTPSIIAELVAASPIWAHTREPLEYENQELLYYSYYNIDDKPHGANNASSMTKHIQRKHPQVSIEKGLSKGQEVVR